MNVTMRRPDCFECGRPVEDRPAWLVHPECREVLRLVWSGRGIRKEEVLPNMGRVGRQRRAAGVGRFPGYAMLKKTRDDVRGDRSAPPCQTPGCVEPATRFDWQPHGDARDDRPRPSDIHLLCDAHHLDVARTHVDADERIAHTAMAIWARIEAAEPLVPRDEADYWDAGRSRLLTTWPFADEQTFSDFQEWAGLLVANSEGHSSDLNESLPDWTDAVDRLRLPRPRRRRLLRALNEGLWAYVLTLSPRQWQEVREVVA